jgi:hypothetical protein
MAKRMILVDEKLYDSLVRDRQEQWEKPIVQKAKSLLNSELKTDLMDAHGDVPDDIRMKNHQRDLHRFLQLNNKLSDTTPPQTPEVPIVLPVKTKKTKIIVSPILKKHRVKRAVIKPSKINWTEWDLH